LKVSRKDLRGKPILNLIGKLRNSLWGEGLALTALALTAGLSALRLAFNLGYHYELFRCVYPSLSPDAPFFVQLKWALSFEGEKILLVTLALVFSLVCLWTTRVLGFLLSLISLTCLGALYVMWYLATLSNMRLFGARDFSEVPDQKQHLLPLLGASWWDIVVLGVAMAVFVWQAAMIKRILKSETNTQP
jgi:hypothetical protein